jgi:beta-lactam-binding protein with PASTA domain
MSLQGIDFGGPAGAEGGPGEKPVPDVTGDSRSQAEKKLKALGFKFNVTEVEADGTQDQVFSQTPAPFTNKSPGSEVELFVIKNPSPQPDFEQRFTALDAAVNAISVKLNDVATAAALTEVKNEVTSVRTAVTELAGKVGDGPVTGKLDAIMERLPERGQQAQAKPAKQ